MDHLDVGYNASLDERKQVFNQRIQGSRSSENLLNPYVNQWDNVVTGVVASRSPSPSRRGDPGYGRPEPGSLTEMRGIKAHQYINKEVETLCEIIRKYGNETSDGYVITFRALFQIYVAISDKVVGLLLRARKHHLVDFEGEMLFQGRDDGTLIKLFKQPKEPSAQE